MRVENGNIYRLAFAGEALTAATILKWYAIKESTAMSVKMTTACADKVVGATSFAVTDQHWFWMLVNGIIELTTDTGIGAGVMLMPQATGPGIVDTYASLATSGGTNQNIYCGLTLEADRTAACICWFRAGCVGNSLA